jgi:UrcA family protein
MIRNILALFGLVSVALVSAIAINAQSWVGATWDKPPSLRVSFNDLDLASPGGEHELKRRIAHAVDRICGRAEAMDLAGRRLEMKCRRDAWQSTSRQVADAIEKARAQHLAAASAGAGPAALAIGSR